MAKRKLRGAESVVVALCLDYQRRAEEIAASKLPRRILMEYSYYNSRIFEGVGEIVGAALAEVFIYEIGNRRGYASTEITTISESTYKRYKAEAVKNVARKLHYAL